MEKEFEILEHTADIGITAYGTDLKEAFANAARGMFSLITELGDIKEVEHREIELIADDRENLLVQWLNELIYLFDVENMLFNRFDISRLDETHLKAICYGEKADSSRHTLKTGIKAATYHMLEIEISNGSRIQVLFDI